MIRRIGVSDREGWNRALEAIPHGFGHTWESNSLLRDDADVFLAVVRTELGAVACPFVERQVGGAKDIVTPYGYSGFVGSVVPEFRALWRQFVESQGYVAGYLTLHPSLADLSLYPAEDRFSTNEVFLWDLTPSEDALYAGLGGKGKRSDVKAKPGSRWVEDVEELEAAFLRLYPASMERLGASQVYRFSERTLRALCRSSQSALFGVATDRGVQAVSLFTWGSEATAEYFLNATSEEGRGHSARLLWESALRLRARGFQRLNLGGGIRVGDGLAKFKSRFGGAAVPLISVKQVYAPQAYEALCDAHGVPPHREGYFPPYHRPGAAQSIRPL